MRKLPKTNKFIDEILMWVVGIGGLLLALYCVWLQSGGISIATGEVVVSFGFYYIEFFFAFAVVLAGTVAGYGINSYFRSEAKKSSELSPLTPLDFLRTARGYLVLFPIAALAGFFMSEVLWVLVGVFGMVFASTGLIFYRLWVISWEKEQKKAAA
ncbi:MAG: hypothetical protein J5794_06030 [Lachnospiraceae bacterium]|nr:hypothetical protein [Lachnospiraceae bacterium]